MNLKRVLSLVLIAISLFAFVACNDEAQTESESTPAESNEQLAGQAVVGAATDGQQTGESSQPAQAPAANGQNGQFKDSLEAKAASVDWVGDLPPVGEDNKQDAIDFALRDQNGNYHSLKDYLGKVVILNFWQTWCPPCRAELPDFQKVYKDLGENAQDVVILGVSSPANEAQTYSQEQKSDVEIKAFLEENGISYPSLMDYKGELYNKYSVFSFPTSLFIDSKGKVYGVLPGSISEANLLKLIEDCKNSVSE